jgi:hypothetical protein
MDGFFDVRAMDANLSQVLAIFEDFLTAIVVFTADSSISFAVAALSVSRAR